MIIRTSHHDSNYSAFSVVTFLVLLLSTISLPLAVLAGLVDYI
jgi:hypothetical protein